MKKIPLFIQIGEITASSPSVISGSGSVLARWYRTPSLVWQPQSDKCLKHRYSWMRMLIKRRARRPMHPCTRQPRLWLRNSSSMFQMTRRELHKSFVPAFMIQNYFGMNMQVGSLDIITCAPTKRQMNLTRPKKRIAAWKRHSSSSRPPIVAIESSWLQNHCPGSWQEFKGAIHECTTHQHQIFY